MRHRNMWRRLLGLSAVFHIVMNIALTCILLRVSHHNYPGGIALHTLHNIESKSLGVFLIFCWLLYLLPVVVVFLYIVRKYLSVPKQV